MLRVWKNRQLGVKFVNPIIGIVTLILIAQGSLVALAESHSLEPGSSGLQPTDNVDTAEVTEAGELGDLESDDESDAGEDGEDDEQLASGQDKTEPTLEEEQSSEGGFVQQAQIEERELAQLAEKRTAPVLRDTREYIDLQPTVESWAKKTAGKVAVEVFDLDYGRMAASYQASSAMRPKSLYKLFYAYDGYTQVSQGAEDANKPYLGETSLGHCLDIMIRNSDNPCAEAMLDDPVRASRVGALVSGLGLSQTQADGLLTSAHDVSRLLQQYWVHPGWSGEAWTKFLNSALSQPARLRRGLPSGLQSATVYNKAGFGPNEGGYVYNDAAIVSFPGNGANGGRARHYIVVVMTAGASQASLADLGARLERAIMYNQ